MSLHLKTLEFPIYTIRQRSCDFLKVFTLSRSELSQAGYIVHRVQDRPGMEIYVVRKAINLNDDCFICEPTSTGKCFFQSSVNFPMHSFHFSIHFVKHNLFLFWSIKWRRMLRKRMKILSFHFGPFLFYMYFRIW